MDITCPHCGTEYEVEKQDMYRYTKCEVCGKGFVVGATSSLLAESSAAQPSKGRQSMACGAKPQPRRSVVPRSRPFANINKTSAIPNFRPQRSRSTNSVMWFSLGGVCLVLVIALAVVITTRGNRRGKATAIAASEVVTHAEEVVQNDGSTPMASAVEADEKKEDYISKLIKEAKAGSVLSEVSQCELGDCYSEGKGVEVNHTEAVKWYRMSAERGFAIAQENLGVKYANGRGVEKDESEAVKWYRKAAEQGRPSSQYLLGCCYDQGKGVEKDEKEAAKWYRKAADQGFSFAQYCLGVCYEMGEGVEKDEEEAVKWYRKAAEQGHTDAQFSLGECYYNGEGVDENLDEAAKWYRKAADQGNANAQYGLANCYYEGEGVEYNPTETLNWLRKAAAQGHADAQKSLKDAIERQNKYKSDVDLVKAFEVYRRNDKSEMSVGGVIVAFLVNEGGWDKRHCRDVIRNSLRKGRRLEDMPEDERKEYMAGSEYGKGEQDEVATVAGKTQGRTETVGNVLKGCNPLEQFHFGDKPTQALTEKDGSRIVQYAIQDFLGIQRMTLAYTRKGTLFSICFVSENDHYSAAESDARVYKLMQLCDEWYDGIEWDIGEQEHDGRKFAVGRIKSTVAMVEGPNGNLVNKYNFQDMIFSIIPTRGERNVVGLQVNLIDNRRRRLDHYNGDAIHLFSATSDEYQEIRKWLKEQFSANSLSVYQFDRLYDKNLKMYHYSLRLDWGSGKMIGSNYYIKQIDICLYNGVLETDCKIGIKRLHNPLSDEYAEAIIMAKIKTFNKEMEGIAGSISDNRGTGASIRLPCPACHGQSASTQCRECYNKSRNRNAGIVSLSKSEFKEKFSAYKEYYRTRRAPYGWHDKTKSNSKPSKPKSPPLHKEPKPTARAQRDIDHVLRSGRESSRKFNKRRLH